MPAKKNFAIKGQILYAPTSKEIICVENGWLVCEEGLVAGVFSDLPERFIGMETVDFGGKLIVPGLTDLHVHAPQYAFRGLGMDLELLDWLSTHTFPEEAKYADMVYAEKAYSLFARELQRGAATRACIFATVHVPATLRLMELLEDTGLITMVGKVNMDRNCPDSLKEDSGDSLARTKDWLNQSAGRFKNTTPILTPRFTPSCTDGLMEGLGALQKETGLPVQSHLSENISEAAWVKELCPAAPSYCGTYDGHGLLNQKTIMAHCVHCTDEEIALLKERGAFVAHCAQSNTNLSSGAAPARSYLRQGVSMGLGTDLAGGASPSIFRAMADAVQASKLRWRLFDDSLEPLTVPEAFYLGTKGGGAFFGKVGSFEPDYAFDAVVLDDSYLPYPQELTPLERLERFIYLSDDRGVCAKYINGARREK